SAARPRREENSRRTNGRRGRETCHAAAWTLALVFPETPLGVGRHVGGVRGRNRHPVERGATVVSAYRLKLISLECPHRSGGHVVHTDATLAGCGGAGFARQSCGRHDVHHDRGEWAVSCIQYGLSAGVSERAEPAATNRSGRRTIDGKSGAE